MTKKSYSKHIISLLLIFIVSVSMGATELSRAVRFSSITINEGLSQNTVFDIVQDDLGNLWIATADGLNKYDGHRFTIYKHDEEEKNSLQSDLIRSLEINEQQQLLIGTRFGFTVYNILTNQFRNYPLASQVNKVLPYNDSIYYVVAASGIHKYNNSTQTLKELNAEKQHIFQTAAIYQDRILIGSATGLYVLDLQTNRLTPYREELVNKNIQDICVRGDGVWIATEGNGLYYLSYTGELTNYKHNAQDKNSISSNFVRSLQFDENNRLWIGTFHGLNIFDKNKNTFEHHFSSDVDKGTISQNSVRSIFCDRQGGIWLGTFFGGLNYYHPLQNQFGRMRHIPFTNSLNDNVVSCIVEGIQGDLWIGTNDKGVNKYNTKTGIYTYYTTANSALLSNNIKAILVDDDNIYIGSHGGGMARLNRKTNSITNLTTKNSKIISDNVYAFTKDSKGNIWVGTLNGLTAYDPQSGEFSSFASANPLGDFEHVQKLNSNQVYTLYLDSKNRIWIGAESGIYAFSLNNKLLAHFKIGNSDRDGKINCILEDSDNRIWIGSHSGLRKLNESAQTFTTYTTKEGLPNNNVLGILEDGHNRLWISTYNGLASLTPSTNKIRTYTLTDGIQTDQFNSYSYCKLASGEMYFGGINGITHFFPEKLMDNPYTTQPIITQLSIYNTPILPGDASQILEYNISKTEKIKLSPKQSSFSLTFTSPNFLSAGHNTFAYMLEGVDTDWNYITEVHPVSYSNLAHGEYTFRVKAANSDGVWNEVPTLLDIEIQPHWWQTGWAKLAFVLAILFVAYSIFRFFHNKQMLRNQLSLERLEKDKTEEINQMKLRFFINISHEFRTPLTLIISPLQELLNKSADKWTRDQIKIMQRNANKLLHLVNQLMDYRRADLGVFSLKAEELSPLIQVEEMMNMFQPIARQNNIDFTFENYVGDKKLLYDPNYLDLILSNLLSNAFKFTPHNGCITLKISEVNDKVILEVSDTGKGIKAELKEKIFERFYQINNEDKGTGIGLSLVHRLVDLHHGRIELDSQPNEGSTFRIDLPQDKSVYSKQELEINGNAVQQSHVSEEAIHLLIQPDEEQLSEDANDELPTLLIVEDDPDVRNYLISNLKEIANIQKADNGEDALKIVRENKIDLIITDVMLPVMDGLRFCKAVKQNIRTSHIPVIMLTAKSNQQDQMEGLMAGADDYVYKPFNISILKVKVQNRLKSRVRMLEHYSNSLEIEPDKVTFNEMDREFLEKAKKIVEENMDNINFSVDNFCKEMAMSRSNLHLKMKAITGESTIEFIRKIRFNEACNLLQDGRYSIADISTMVGFNTPSYFTTSFKKYFNILPTEYVKNLRNDN